MARILVVDDVALNLELLDARLKSAGFETILARNGAEALRILEVQRVDMIISDILMPVMDGYQLCRACKQHHALRKVPFVFYTATYTDDKDRVFALGLGAEAFIIKPTEKVRFLEIIEDLLGQYRRGTLRPSHPGVSKIETDYVREYNERLIAKLEKKVQDLETLRAALDREHQRAERETTANIARLESLLSISRFTPSSPRALFDFALRQALSLTGSRRGFIYSSLDNTQTLALTASMSDGSSENGTAPLPRLLGPDADLLQSVLRKKEPLVSNDYGTTYPHREPSWAMERLLLAPILVADDPVAIVGIADKAEHYDETDVRQLQLLMDETWNIKRRHDADRERARLVAAIDQVHEGISILDADGAVSYANAAMYALLGRTSTETCDGLRFKPPDSCLHDKDDQVWKTLAHRATWSGRLKLEADDGSVIDVEATFTPICDDKGDVVSVVLIAKDITEETRTETRLRQSQKMEAIGMLAGGIAHDFNNILSGIFGYAELSLEEPSIQEPARSYLKGLISACERAKDLVGQILSFSRQKEHDKTPVNLLPIIKETCKFLRATLPPAIQIRQESLSNADLIMGDASQLHQVLMNLGTNAGYAMREGGGILEITLDKKILSESESAHFPNLVAGEYVQISVKDTGPGIPNDILPRIFEPYFTTKEKGEGTGLGLAVVHGIVTDHNGEIKVYSENGRGVVFHLLFPLLSTTPPEPRASQLEAIPGGSERILIIDDELTVQAVTKLVLERLGYVVETYSNPFDALDRLIHDKNAFDLIITDKSMPEMSGFDLARLVSEIRTDLPVVLCTGFLERSDTARADALGIKEVILKPITVAALGNAVRRALQHRPPA